MFEPDTNKYDKALLSDVMHLSPYGWYKIDRFIIDNYHLVYEK
jgi:poly-D-alanine transfer protein DltD